MISNSLFHPAGTPTITDKQYQRAAANFRDSIACLSWLEHDYPNILASSSWDSTLTLQYVIARDAEVSTVENIYEGARRNTPTPAISLAWQTPEKKLIAGSIDGSIDLIDPNDFPISQPIGKHDDAVKGVYYLEESRTICSLSYDKTMKFWDPRSASQIISFNLGAKAVCSDMLFPYIAIGLSNEKLLIFDIVRDINAVFRDRDNHYINSPLGSDSPISTISISKENTLGVGNYDGRSNLSKFERRSDGTTSLENIVTFKAHKIDPGQNGNTSNLKILYPIHAVGFHPLNRNTYFTAGGDGCVNFWDIPARNKLAFFTCTNAPITAAKYSPNGKFLAYAYGYDWAKGIEGSMTIKPKIHIHSTQLDELARSTSVPTITDKEFKRGPTNFGDSVACLSWGQDENPNVLLCSTWDGFVYLYYVSPRYADAEITTVDNIYDGYQRSVIAPCISLAWQSTAKKIITGSIDGTILSMDPNALSIQTIGKHDDAVKGVYYIEQSNIICSLSYDKTLKFWDTRLPVPAASYNLGDKIICSDYLFPHMAVGLANEKLLIFDIANDTPSMCRALDRYYIDSPLGSNSPISTISISKEDKVGIATYDGRSNLSSFQRNSDGVMRLENIVTFKAHKIDPGQNGNTSNLKILYPIHAVGFHPRNRNTYFTAGGDGCVNIWDIPARNKLAFWTCTNTPITAAKYSPNGKLLAYAYGYDWAKGIEGSKTIKPKLHIHTTRSEELATV